MPFGKRSAAKKKITNQEQDFINIDFWCLFTKYFTVSLLNCNDFNTYGLHTRWFLSRIECKS